MARKPLNADADGAVRQETHVVSRSFALRTANSIRHIEAGTELVVGEDDSLISALYLQGAHIKPKAAA